MHDKDGSANGAGTRRLFPSLGKIITDMIDHLHPGLTPRQRAAANKAGEWMAQEAYRLQLWAILEHRDKDYAGSDLIKEVVEIVVDDYLCGFTNKAGTTWLQFGTPPTEWTEQNRMNSAERKMSGQQVIETLANA
jgi:hypothetical protein